MEPATELKESKMKEIRCLMCPSWQVMMKECELIERALCELDELYAQLGNCP
jgi:hypothetical protein